MQHQQQEQREIRNAMTWQQFINFYCDLSKESGYTSRHMDFMEPHRMAFLLATAIELVDAGETVARDKAKQALFDLQTRLNNTAQWN